MCLFSWHVQLKQLQTGDTTRCLARAFANTCAQTGYREKEEASAQLRYFKGTEKEFLFGTKKPFFLGMS